MPSKKKKYNARFPPARIKKIMQMDEEVGKVAATVPVIISRALELFIESLIQQATQMTQSKNAKTLSASHIKHIIESEERYHFLKELVSDIADYQVEEEGIPNHSIEGDNNASTVHGRKPRGRPRKTKDGNQASQKKERQKKKKESSSSDSENSQEETDDADEGTDEESTVLSASASAPGVPSSVSITETFPSSISATNSPALSTMSSTTTLNNPPPISDLLAQSQEQQQQQACVVQHQDATFMPMDLSQAVHQQQQQQQQVSLPAVSLEDLSTFQSISTMLPVSATQPVYQTVSATAAPHLFWPGPIGMLAPAGTGFPSIATQGFTAGLGQPQAAPGFPGMILQGLGLQAMSPSLMPLPGMPFSSGLSPLTAAGFAGVSMAGTALAGVQSVAASVSSATNGAQVDDDYDT